MPAAAWTAFRELDLVLEELVRSVTAVLGDSLVGVYLHGSFALGAGDEYSDVDFLVVTAGPVERGQLDALQGMHARLYSLDVPWAQHLEGSYAPAAELRRVEPTPSRWWYLDNGSSELVLDTHCNTAVVRRTVREHGIVLSGQPPATLVDRVHPDVLRSEARAAIREYCEWAAEPTKAGGMSRWKQPYLVLTFCRMLLTLVTGDVHSKPGAGEWALATLEPEWTDLVRRALADRPDPWTRVYQPADPDVTERTLAFAEYALARASRSSHS